MSLLLELVVSIRDLSVLIHLIDMGADLPEAERKRFAAKAVKDIMKTL